MASARPRFWVDIRRRVRYSGFMESRGRKAAGEGENRMVTGFYRVSRGGLALEAQAAALDEGLTVTVGGGRSHVGSVAIAQPRPSLRGDGTVSCTCSVWNQLGHKDEAVARPIAERLCRALNAVVVVSAGVHLTGADAAQIEMVERLAEELAEKILEDRKTAG